MVTCVQSVFSLVQGVNYAALLRNLYTLLWVMMNMGNVDPELESNTHRLLTITPPMLHDVTT